MALDTKENEYRLALHTAERLARSDCKAPMPLRWDLLSDPIRVMYRLVATAVRTYILA